MNKKIISVSNEKITNEDVNKRYTYISSNDKRMLVNKDLIVGRKINERTFSRTTYLDSYLSALKWISKNILSNKEVNDTKFEFIKSEDGKSIILNMYSTTTLKSVIERHCKCCSESSECFWSEKTDCSVCHSRALKNRIEDMTNDIADWYESNINKIN